MANIDLGNLTRYDGKIKQYAEDKYLSKNTANWQMTEKAGAVTCYPVPDTELEPIVDFSFKEVPPAEGEKSPSNPSTITGVTNVSLWLAGKNINHTIPYYGFVNGERTLYGVTFKANADGSVTVNGTATANANCPMFDSNHTSLYGVPIGVGTWRLSGCPIGGSYNSYAIQPVIASEYGSVAFDYGSGSVMTVTKPGAKTGLILRIASGYTAQNMVFKPQIELASTATEYEQSIEKQEYTINFNDTYYGGSINLATGLITVTWESKILNGTESFAKNTNYSTNKLSVFSGTFGISQGTMSATPGDLTRSCSHFTYSTVSSIGKFTTWATSTNVFFGMDATQYPTKESFASWLTDQYNNETPVILCYKLSNPYTVQLDPVQIKSLTALDKNTPRLNTLYTDADSIQVGYQKHPARTAYELENAILALGGGE